jgi:hypothetical protein
MSLVKSEELTPSESKTTKTADTNFGRRSRCCSSPLSIVFASFIGAGASGGEDQEHLAWQCLDSDRGNQTNPGSALMLQSSAFIADQAGGGGEDFGFRTIFAQKKAIYVQWILRCNLNLPSKRGNGYENRSGSYDGRIPHNVL